MNCLQAEEHFSAHFEDALDYQTLQRFEEHLTTCQVCQREYIRFQESVKAIQQLPQIEPSPEFMPALLQRLSAEQRESSGVREVIQTGWERLQDLFRRPRWAFGGIVAVLLIAAVGGYLYQNGLLSDRDAKPAIVVTPASEPSQVRTPPVALPVDVPRSVKDVNRFLPSDVISPSRQPMQRRYVLKQVSYTNASTRGGL